MNLLVEHAKDELKRAGLFDKSSDYEGMLGEAVLDLIKIFSAQEHSGFSAGMARELFYLLSSYKTLTPLTSDPSEWTKVIDDDPQYPGKALWQNKRNFSAFSNDGGKTYYDLDDMDKLKETTSFKIKSFLLGLVGIKTDLKKCVLKKLNGSKS